MTLLECPLCGAGTQNSHGLCSECEAALPRPLRPCQRCAVEIPAGGPWRDYCENCLLTPPGFDRCLCAFRYEFPVRELIASFKFQADFATGRTLAALLASRLADAWSDAQHLPVLIPVPLHRSRLRERGFNQSALLAAALAERCNLKIARQHCRRTRATHSQRGLRANERSSNLQRAFALSDPTLVFPHIVIVDDVVTTTATVEEVARLYRRAGTRRIDVACLARVS
jgi:ComF family protein